MANFVKLGTGNIVETVIGVSNSVITDSNGIEQEQLGVDFINTLYNTRDIWKQTSYNTRGGKYYNSDNTLGDQSKSFRKNYAGIGFFYDDVRNAFYTQKPYSSWILNEETCYWEAPIQRPTVELEYGKQLYVWNERVQNWEIKNL
jgi:hypothetical protein